MKRIITLVATVSIVIILMATVLMPAINSNSKEIEAVGANTVTDSMMHYTHWDGVGTLTVEQKNDGANYIEINGVRQTYTVGDEHWSVLSDNLILTANGTPAGPVSMYFYGINGSSAVTSTTVHPGLKVTFSGGTMTLFYSEGSTKNFTAPYTYVYYPDPDGDHIQWRSTLSGGWILDDDGQILFYGYQNGSPGNGIAIYDCSTGTLTQKWHMTSGTIDTSTTTATATVITEEVGKDELPYLTSCPASYRNAIVPIAYKYTENGPGNDILMVIPIMVLISLVMMAVGTFTGRRD